MNPDRQKSISYFRTPPCNYTCAQAILKGFQQEFAIKDDLVDEFAEYRGGRAPDGVCGAVYAANYLLRQKGFEPINETFAAKAGSDKCIEIKGTYRFPCPDCIILADQLIEEEIKRQQ